MGDETKRKELKRGNYDPLHATRKPSTADAVDERTPQVAEMPERAEEIPESSPPRRRGE